MTKLKTKLEIKNEIKRLGETVLRCRLRHTNGANGELEGMIAMSQVQALVWVIGELPKPEARLRTSQFNDLIK